MLLCDVVWSPDFLGFVKSLNEDNILTKEGCGEKWHYCCPFCGLYVSILFGAEASRWWDVPCWCCLDIACMWILSSSSMYWFKLLLSQFILYLCSGYVNYINDTMLPLLRDTCTKHLNSATYCSNIPCYIR